MDIAILTPRPDYSAEWRWAYDVEAGAIAESGATVTPVPWNERFEPRRFDLVLPLVAWGYHQHFADWTAILDRFERDRVPVLNPVPLLRWNSDKRYLAELFEAGVPTVPTEIAQSLDDGSLAAAREHFETDRLVVKPLVSASAYHTYRIGPDDCVPEPVRGSTMMVQPWLDSILTTGEWSLIFFGGEFSHCVAKRPKSGEFRVQPEFGGLIARSDPPEGGIAIAEDALSRAPSPALYARIDLVRGNDGRLGVIEMEMVEPAFFLAEAPEARSRLASAVLSAVSGTWPAATA